MSNWYTNKEYPQNRWIYVLGECHSTTRRWPILELCKKLHEFVPVGPNSHCILNNSNTELLAWKHWEKNEPHITEGLPKKFGSWIMNKKYPPNRLFYVLLETEITPLKEFPDFKKYPPSIELCTFTDGNLITSSSIKPDRILNTKKHIKILGWFNEN